jgi:nicotinate-nucleotide--dimethylbenzimidazole phosphoribosyltransferase
VVVVGEIGIGNTTVAAALLSALTGLSAQAVCGRGTGLDAQGLDRKRGVVAAALSANSCSRDDALGCALPPALLRWSRVAFSPPLRDDLIAGHRLAEPAHAHVLTELGLEPLLDLRLRLGEGSGAALALPLLGLAARLHAEMGRFDETGVERAARNRGSV